MIYESSGSTAFKNSVVHYMGSETPLKTTVSEGGSLLHLQKQTYHIKTKSNQSKFEIVFRNCPHSIPLVLH